MDIRPPQPRPKSRPLQSQTTEDVAPVQRPIISPVILDDMETPPVSAPKKRWLLRIMLIIVSFLVLLFVAILGWYYYMLQPLDSQASRQTVVVESGMRPQTIAALLSEKQIIRNSFAFEVYVFLNGHSSTLRAGSYQLSAAQSVPDIVDELLGGRDDVLNVIIVPGMTLKKLADPAVKNSLAAQGFSQSEIAEAFAATYVSPVLADRPTGASLEGYIFPDTYQIRRQDGLKSLVQKAIDELYGHIQSEGMTEKFATHGLTIYQAVTLASLVQLEVTPAADQRQVAQVFFKRLAEGISLGSDVTFVYAANQAGVAPTADFDSPYNTRLHVGLPPGPVSNMGLSALQAVANPASGDYLYFVSGDDGITHFTRTYEEHQAATAAYCQVLCRQY